MPTLFDASNWLLYFPEHLDTRRSLWFVRDVMDLDAWRENAITLAAGADFENFRDCKPFFEAFPSIFIALGDRELAETTADALMEASVAVPVLLPRKGAFGKAKNVREVLSAGGETAASRLILGAEERAPGGLLDLGDVERVEPMDHPVVLSGIRALDSAIGGFFPGEVTVWTGKRGSGKSTLLGQTLLDAIDQGTRVCAYSGELSAWRFKQWLALQAAGPEYVERCTDPRSEKEYWRVPAPVMEQIDQWWKGRFFLYDNRVSAASDEDSILSVFEYALRRYGCALFLVDNLMSARFSTSADRDFYRAQSNFVGRLVEFAKKYEGHVHLVAHPRKADKILDADEVGGSGDITNRADNVLALDRLDEQKATEKGYDAVLSVLKNRAFGESGKFGLIFNPSCRRYVRVGERPKHYGWEHIKPILTEVKDDGGEPF